MQQLFPRHDENAPAGSAVFLSGTGSNAEAIIRYCRQRKCAFSVEVLVTDNPGSRAKELSVLYDLPLLELDIHSFYARRGENSIKLDTPRRQQIRDEWSSALFEMMKPYRIELVLLAGFVPLTSLTGMLPCLNVHPGDLTITDASGRRPYAGLHYKPVEDAICNGLAHIRSSVIVAQPYSGNGKDEMDSGPVIGISEKIPFDLAPETAESLSAVRRTRIPGKRPDDMLRQKAVQAIEKMKVCGDHVIFPAAADDFARGRFWMGENGSLLFQNGNTFTEILSVEYSPEGKTLLNKE